MAFICPLDQRELRLDELLDHAKSVHGFQGENLHKDFGENSFVDKGLLKQVKDNKSVMISIALIA